MIHPTCQIPNLETIYKQYFNSPIFFVEVGAFDGMTYSNTWGMGWNGVYIEANPDFIEQIKLNHQENPNIRILNYACGHQNGDIDLIIYGDVSTTKLSRWNRDWGMNEETPKVRVPMRTLNTILTEQNISNFDLLVIDVEEMEAEVLSGFDVDKYKPKMIIVELHETQGTAPFQKGYQEPWVTEYLKGYKKIYKDAINTIFYRNL